MPRITTSIGAALLAVTVTACNRAPTPPAAPSPPSPPTPPAPQVLTYQCHSPQKTRDFFARFDEHSALYLGDTATDMKPTGDVVLFDKSGMASWSKKNGSWTETSSFNKNTGEWEWSNDPGAGAPVDSAHYSCKQV